MASKGTPGQSTRPPFGNTGESGGTLDCIDGDGSKSIGMSRDYNDSRITITMISHLPLQRELGANENLEVGAGLRSRVCQVPSHPLQLHPFLATHAFST